jgi:anti-sigma factor RsiW
MRSAEATCAQLRAQIEKYLDGELEHVACEAIERHCDGCAACAGLVRGLKQTIGLCREAGRVALPDSVSRKAREQASRLLGGQTP